MFLGLDEMNKVFGCLIANNFWLFVLRMCMFECVYTGPNSVNIIRFRFEVHTFIYQIIRLYGSCEFDFH